MNMGKMMKQVQKMQADMAKMQEELADRTMETSAGGGAVKVVANGKKEIKEVIIDPQAVDPEDVEMLQDLIISAVNEVLKKVDDMVAEEMQKISGGMNLPPGLF